MRIDSSFAEADIGKIREGQAVRFTVDAFPERSFEGRVQQIRLNPTTQQNVVTYNVRVSLANPEHILLPGMTAYVSIAVAQRDDALLLPNAALRFKPPEDADKPLPAQPTERTARADSANGKGRKRDADGSSGTVHVVDQGQLKAVRVQLGITDNRNSEVLAGELKAGQQVVVGENPLNSGGKPSSVGLRLF